MAISLCLLLISFVFPEVYAQEQLSDPLGTIELYADTETTEKASDTSFISFVGLFFLLLGVPFAINLFLRRINVGMLKSYIFTYGLVALIFYLCQFLLPDLPRSSFSMTMIFLLLISMLGSFFSQVTYYIMLVRREKTRRD